MVQPAWVKSNPSSNYQRYPALKCACLQPAVATLVELVEARLLAQIPLGSVSVTHQMDTLAPNVMTVVMDTI